MPTVDPSLVLLAVLLLTAAAVAGAWLARRLWLNRLRNLAREAGGYLSPHADERHLQWVLPLLPAVSPGSVCLWDVIEVPLDQAVVGAEGAAGVGGQSSSRVNRSVPARRVVLRADYTVGTTHGRRNRTRILAATLAGNVAGEHATASLGEERLEQYRMLLVPPAPAVPSHPVAEVTR